MTKYVGFDMLKGSCATYGIVSMFSGAVDERLSPLPYMRAALPPI